jgi:PHD/YefM family antitoxin component YafN of YafNO toxin-antitoxin module
VFAGAVKRAPYVGAAAGALAAGKIFKNEDGSFNPVAAGLGGLGAGYLTKQLHPKIQQWASNPGNVGAEAARAVGAPPVAGTPTPKPTSNFQDILKQRMDAQKRLALKQKGVPNAALMPAERLQSKAVNPRIAQAQAERLMGREALHQTGIKYQALPNLSKEQLSGLAQGEASTLSGLQRLRGAARIKASGRVGGFLRRLATKHAEDKVRGVLRGRR